MRRGVGYIILYCFRSNLRQKCGLNSLQIGWYLAANIAADCTQSYGAKSTGTEKSLVDIGLRCCNPLEGRNSTNATQQVCCFKSAGDSQEDCSSSAQQELRSRRYLALWHTLVLSADWWLVAPVSKQYLGRVCFSTDASLFCLANTR